MLQARNGSPDYHPEIPPLAPEEKGVDFLQVVWRWKWVTLAGAVAGAIVGYLLYSKQEPTYQSSAMIQVVYPTVEAAGLETIEGPDGIRGQSRLDESLIIKSARVIDLAIEIGRLKEKPLLEGKTPSQIRSWILNPKRLVVEPAGRDSSTALIELSFVCEDEELSQTVIDAVISGYDSYLELAYKNLGDEVVKVVKQAREELRKDYDDLSAQHARFRKEAPMIWLGDEARNQFAENSIEINTSINQIQIEIQKLQATLQHLADAERQGRSPEAILLMLASDNAMVGALTNSEPGKEPGIKTAKEELPYSSAERRAVLMELQIREQELLDTVGEEHPAIATIRRKIMLLDRQIANLADSEVRIEAQHQAIAGGQLPSEMTPQEKLTLCRASMQERLAALARQDRLLRDLAADNEVKSKELQEYLTQNQLLNSELDSVQKLLDGFNDTLNRIQILPQGSRRTLETLTPAAMGEFYGPALVPYLFGGTTLGFLLLAGCALLVDWLDQSFRNPDEISSTLGLSIVGHIPQMDLKNKASHLPPLDPSLCTVAGTCENASEAIRSVRTGLFFSESGSGHRIIQVTSPVPGDGKSTVSANLAAAIAQSGRTVLLIDADLRRPRVAKLFGFNQKQGLADILQGRKGLEDLVNSCPIPNLSVLAGLSEVSNPTELLSHHRFVELLDTVRKNYDYVIVDSPPVLAAADACAVAARVDGVLLTIRLRRDSKPVAIRASKILETVGARVLGIVVNGVTGRGYEYRYDNYGYYGVHKPRSEASYPNLAGPNLIAEQESPALTKRY